MPDASGSGKDEQAYDLARLDQFPQLTHERLRLAYREACLARLHVERVVQECLKGQVKFAIWGPGEEIHGTASALAFQDTVDPDRFAICGHYRSASMLGTWARLRGYDDFHLDHMRQQLSKATDPWSGGRQMTAHFNDMRHNALPVQSALGMQVSKSVGYAQGYKVRGIDDALVVCVVGDGTCAEGDVHEGMTGASILQLPWLLIVTDNNVAISVTPQDGRGIKDFESYAKAFGFAYFTCDGNDFVDVYDVTKRASEFCRSQQKPALLWVRNLSRLNDHSSAADVTFKFDQYDPLLDFGKALVKRGILSEGDNITRKDGPTKDYYARHELGRVAAEADAYIVGTMEIAGSEPEPDVHSVYEHIRDPYPVSVEPPPVGRQTVISINGAVRSAMRAILRQNPMTWIYGQDVAKKGGVMQATRGLWDDFPRQVRDAPINEPFIMGSAIGFALHEGSTALPEIQFSDYSLNTLHWLVYLGNLLWTSGGSVRANVVVRLPVEPLHGGAVYHSMCMEGFYASIPGLTIVAPTTSRDVYGLLRSAAEYSGPVLFFESKGLYRMNLGDAFPGEPTDPKEVATLKRAIAFEGHAPDLPDDFRVPLGKAALRRQGRDLTIVTWGRTTLYVAEAANRLASEGIEAEVIDLRTIVPPDMDAVLASVKRTGRLLVVHEDRVFASLGREIQGATIEAFDAAGTPVVARVLGQDPVPGIPQNAHLEEHVVVTPDKVFAAAKAVLAVKRASAPESRTRTLSMAAPTVLWTPNRNFVA
ncbi:MAG TPA: thiamine pyrophosphate-dependent enzyme [Nannocystaceae bacterium]|nr:thiamine pyrophosphate-dependent enzyme [Nannocystaceae bacterium]